MRILSDLVIPILLVLPLLKDGFRENYSSLSAKKDPLFLICLIPVFLYTVYMTHSLAGNSRHLRLLFSVYVLFFIMTLIIPYHIPEDIWSSLHLVFSYGAFLIFQLIIFSKLFLKKDLLQFYLAGLFLSLLITFTAASINAPAEAVCGILISVVLQRLQS